MPFIKDIQNSWNMKDGAFLLSATYMNKKINLCR